MHGTKVLHTLGALSGIDFSLNCFHFAVATVRFEQNYYVVNESVVSFTIGVILTGDISIPIDARYV